jgi:hypothetical protein
MDGPGAINLAAFASASACHALLAICSVCNPKSSAPALPACKPASDFAVRLKEQDA